MKVQLTIEKQHDDRAEIKVTNTIGATDNLVAVIDVPEGCCQFATEIDLGMNQQLTVEALQKAPRAAKSSTKRSAK